MLILQAKHFGIDASRELRKVSLDYQSKKNADWEKQKKFEITQIVDP